MKLTGFLDINPLGSSTPTWASLVAGVFVLITLSLSMYLLFEHLSSYKNPEVLLHHNYNFIVLSLDICSVWCIYLVNLCFFFFVFFALTWQEQKFLIGVILMVPCYAIESVSLWEVIFYINLKDEWNLHSIVSWWIEPVGGCVWVVFF